MNISFWKTAGIIIILFSIVAGLLVNVPDLPVVHESIRNLFFHVCMWFSMIFMFLVSVVFSIKYLSGFRENDDITASQAVSTGILFGILGLVTGSVWAKSTWGVFWTNDPLLNGAAVTMFAYLAYVVLRNSLDESNKRAKVSAVYNIFAFVILIVFLFILPGNAETSLHPGKGKGMPMTISGLDNQMRLVFYPAVTGWLLISLWILTLKIRIRKIGKYLSDLN